MARERGLYGFEPGDLTGLTPLGGAGASNMVADAASARSGTYRFNSKVTVAAVARGVRWTLQAAFGNADHFEFRFRFYFRPVVFPSADNVMIGGLAAFLILDMDTGGKLRIEGSGFVGLPTAYTADATVLNRWYRADFRLHGLKNTGGKTNSGRMRGTVDVYDVGTTGLASPTLFASFETDNQAARSEGLSCTGGFLDANDVNMSFVTVSAEALDYSLEGTTTNFTTVISETKVRSTVTCPPTPGSGTYIEKGTLDGLALNEFQIFNSITLPTLLWGQDANGVNATREVDYDDSYYDFGTGTDRASVAFPAGTRIYPFALTGQGADDGFVPAGAFANVNEIPMGANTISSGTAGARTTYTHAALADPTEVVYHARCWMNATDAGSNSHDILIGATAYPFVFSAVTGGADVSTNKADAPQDTPMLAADFATLEWGARVGAAGTLVIKNIVMEILGGPPAVLGATTGLAGRWLAVSGPTAAAGSAPALARRWAPLGAAVPAAGSAPTVARRWVPILGPN